MLVEAKGRVVGGGREVEVELGATAAAAGIEAFGLGGGLGFGAALSFGEDLALVGWLVGGGWIVGTKAEVLPPICRAKGKRRKEG